MVFDLSAYLLKKAGNLQELDGFVIQPNRNEDSFSVIATADNYFTPQISFLVHFFDYRPLAFGYILPATGRIWDLLPLETCAARRTRNWGTPSKKVFPMRTDSMISSCAVLFASRTYFSSESFL